MAVEVIAGAIGQIAGMAGQFAQARNTKMQGSLADKQGFQETQSRLLQLRQQREAQRQQEIEQRAKTRRTAIIAISVFLAVAVLSLVFYFTIKNKKQ